MLDSLKQFFDKHLGSGSGGARSEDDILVAVCALFVEMARIDEAFTAEEMDAVLGLLVDRYGLSVEDANSLVVEADHALADSVDLWQFARRINTHYGISEKLEIVDALWRIVYLDGKMDAHEHYLMSKLKHLLRLDHEQLIASKLKVRAQLRAGGTAG